MDTQVRFDGGQLHLRGEMTVYTCGELKTQLFEQLKSHPAVTALELSQVTQMDTAGLQILLIAQRYAGARVESFRSPIPVAPSRSACVVWPRRAPCFKG